MPKNRLPNVIPIGWKPLKLPATANSPAGVCIIYMTITGLRCMFSIDPSSQEGKWQKHLSMSREERYPGWDEMKDMIYGGGLFDPNRPVIMFLPPKNKPELFVNFHDFTFHWFQED